MIDDHGLIFAARLLTAQLIETKVGDDAIDPRLEGAFKAEVSDVAEGLKESFLVDVFRVVL